MMKHQTRTGLSCEEAYFPDDLSAPEEADESVLTEADESVLMELDDRAALAELVEEYTTHTRASLLHREKAQIAMRGILEHLTGGGASAAQMLHALQSVRLL